MERRQRQEARLLEILAGRTSEDSYVDRKRQLPDASLKVARKIAGLCNAARGSEAIWIIGVADGGALIGTGEIDPASWWPSVRKHFEGGVAPEMSELSTVYAEKRFYGLFFQTDRAPYVVRVSSTEPDPLEVPWREGTATRSAKRSELLRLLAATAPTPSYENLESRVYLSNDYYLQGGAQRDESTGLVTHRWSVNFYVTLFVESREPFTMPSHRLTLEIDIPGVGLLEGDPQFWGAGERRARDTIGAGAVTVNEPCRVVVRSSTSAFLAEGFDPAEFQVDAATYNLRVGISNLDNPLVVADALPFSHVDDGHGPSAHIEYVYEKPQL